MTPQLPGWPVHYRIAIDVDQALNPIGASWQAIVRDETEGIAVYTPSPFDSFVEVAIAMFEDLQATYGEQLKLIE